MDILLLYSEISKLVLVQTRGRKVYGKNVQIADHALMTWVQLVLFSMCRRFLVMRDLVEIRAIS